MSTFPTVDVTVACIDAAGFPISGVICSFRLNHGALVSGLVVPEIVTAQTGNDGIVIVHLCPNTICGGSYGVRLASNGYDVRGVAVVPPRDCSLDEIMQLSPYPPLGPIEIALAEAIVAKDSAAAAASAAQGYATSAEANSAAPAWSPATSYSFPDITAYTDGNTYRCTGTDIVGEAPDTSANWVRLTTRMTDFFDLDDGGDLMPAVTPGYSVEFELDVNGDVQPR